MNFVRGRSSVISKKEMQYAADFWTNILLGPKLNKNVMVYIKLDNIFKDSYNIGYCAPRDHDRSNGCREFDVVIEKDLSCREKTLRVLAHELEHVRQFARGELRNDHFRLYYWKPSQAYFLDTDINHARMPWEKQAQRSEHWLMKFYDEHCATNGLKFQVPKTRFG